MSRIILPRVDPYGGCDNMLIGFVAVSCLLGFGIWKYHSVVRIPSIRQLVKSGPVIG